MHVQIAFKPEQVRRWEMAVRGFEGGKGWMNKGEMIGRVVIGGISNV